MIEQRPTTERRKASAALDEARLRQQAIGVRLRQMFDEVVNEDVPAEFLEIVLRADARDSGGTQWARLRRRSGPNAAPPTTRPSSASSCSPLHISAPCRVHS